MAKPRRRKSRRPPMTTIAAAALLHIPQIGPDFRPVLNEMGQLVPMFTLDEARQMTAAQFVSLFDMDHDVYEVLDGPSVWWNYTPRLILAHRTKTKRDRKNIDKVRRGLKKRRAEPCCDTNDDGLPKCDGSCLTARERAAAGIRDAAPRQSKPKRPMEYTRLRATHKRDRRTGKVSRRQA